MLNSAHGQPYVLFEGTILDTALLNRMVGDFAGPVKVMVTNPVYSQDRQHVLIPAGTFLLGDVQKVSATGERRLAVRFHRMLMPDGYSVDLDQFHGLDQAGATGLSDQVNNHYLQIFGASIALGVISGAAEATMYGSGYNISGPAMYEQGVASSLSQSGCRCARSLHQHFADHHDPRRPSHQGLSYPGHATASLRKPHHAGRFLMRTLTILLFACFFMAGCDTSTQSLKPSPLHYARVVPNQCALGCCRCKDRQVARAITARKHQPRSH